MPAGQRRQGCRDRKGRGMFGRVADAPEARGVFSAAAPRAALKPRLADRRRVVDGYGVGEVARTVDRAA